MRISEHSRFPHPVLTPESDDFAAGGFDVHFMVEEAPETGRLQLDHDISLTEASIRDLVLSGQASIGCIIRCGDTFYTDLRRLSFPNGRLDFPPGSLLNRVTLRPIVWLEKALNEWDPGTIHAEFLPPVSLASADIIAVAQEHILSVGQAKFQPIESIFELRRSEDLEVGLVRVNPDGDRIAILVASLTYDDISLLRGRDQGLAILMNAVYLPAVMEVLDILRTGASQYESYRWFRPFMARCDAKGLDVTGESSVLETAQQLLDRPMRALAELAREGDV